jgi:integrase
VDLEKGIWTVPAARMKAGREHRVPLSSRAVAILTGVKSLGSPWLFPSNRGGQMSNMSMAMLLRRMQVETTVHGFRSSFRDWAAERTGYTHEVCEMALAHAIKNQAEAAYRRGDLFEKRRRLMEDWARYCSVTSPSWEAESPPFNNVTTLRDTG